MQRCLHDEMFCCFDRTPICDRQIQTYTQIHGQQMTIEYTTIAQHHVVNILKRTYGRNLLKHTDTLKQGYHSPDIKKSLTFPDEIADKVLNKCTFINTKSANTKFHSRFSN